MANITLLGASYTDVPAVTLPQTGGGTVTFYENGGSPTLITKSITANGTYDAEDDNADGYSSVTVNVPEPSGSINITENGTHDVTNYASAVVNVPSSGASSWTKVAETSYQIEYSSTSGTTHATWATGHSEIWTADKWVYVRIRDTAGKRDGYFFGSDQFFYNSSLANGSSPTYISTALRIYTRYSGNEIVATSTTGTNGNGIWADYVYSDGRIRIRKRYNSTSSLTIDGTYKVEVYLLDPAGGVPIFE